MLHMSYGKLSKMLK